MASRELPKKFGKRGVANGAKNHKIRTDTGIEISFPFKPNRTSRLPKISHESGRITIFNKNVAENHKILQLIRLQAKTPRNSFRRVCKLQYLFEYHCVSRVRIVSQRSHRTTKQF